MEPWQYSALNTKFASLQQQLTSSQHSTRPNTNNNHEDVQIEPMQTDCYAMRVGIKRKAEDRLNLTNSLAASDKCRRCHDNLPLLQLDAYTQTHESSVFTHNNSLAMILQAVQATQAKLDGIERFLGALDAKVSLLLRTEHSEADNRVTSHAVDMHSPSSVSSPGTPATPMALTADYTPIPCSKTAGKDAEVASFCCLSPGISPRSAPQGTMNGWSQSTTLSPTSEDKVDECPIRPLEISMQDFQVNATVPLIVAAPAKSGVRSTTMNVSLQDLVNGNVTVEGLGSVSLLRGCWLGNRLDPDSRVWFCGDPKALLPAETSGSNPAKLSLNLLEALCTREEMAASNMSGARGREVLDPIKIKAIYAHVNYKFPLEADKQELRWQLLKPRIDSKCRAQRRAMKDHRACPTTDVTTADTADSERSSRRGRSRKASINPKVKDELLYGYKPNPVPAADLPTQMAVEAIEGDGTSDGVASLANQTPLGFASSSLQQHQ